MKLLFIDCCVSQREKNSRTRRLCDSFIEGFLTVQKDALIERLDLSAQALKPFDKKMLDERDLLVKERKFDSPVFELATQFRDAQRILIGAPFWDLSFPAQLRIYIEHISANGVTYYYDQGGLHGACRAERLAFLTSGGDREQPQSLGLLYWEQLCKMYGIDRFDAVFAGGLDLEPQRAEELLSACCKKARALGADF